VQCVNSIVGRLFNRPAPPLPASRFSSQARLQNPSTPGVSTGTESGNAAGFPVILLHGFPDDVHAWDDVTLALVKAGHRVLTPYLRGFGPTRFGCGDSGWRNKRRSDRCGGLADASNRSASRRGFRLGRQGSVYAAALHEHGPGLF
jgi:pimeloyl-ACP methyl ester carboxylesterase